MKNVNNIQTIVKCDKCNQGGFFIHNRSSCFGDYYSCPLCNSNTYNPDYDYNKLNEIDFEFCSTCNIMFEYGCTHANEGCDWNITNAHFICKYEYKNNIYNGMPQFDNFEDWIRNVDDVKILEMVCLNNGYHCTNSYHPVKGICSIATISQSPPQTSYTFDDKNEIVE